MRISAQLAAALIFAVSFINTATAQTNDFLQQRAREVAAQFRQNPGAYEKLFAPSFLAQIPVAQLDEIFKSLSAQLGKCTDAKLVEAKNVNAGKFDLIFEKGYTVRLTLTIEGAAERLIIGAFFEPPAKSSGTLAEIVGELKNLPGETSLFVAKLNDKGATPIIAHNADKQMPLGSAFKLYILSELVRQINAKERKWSDVVVLRENYKSLPSGIMQNWATDTPITLQTLATLMISISDNTATDALLFELGREKIENAVAASNHAQPNVNQPFLSTSELFKLKTPANQKLAEQYLKLDAKGKRRFLNDTIAPIRRETVEPYGEPRFVESLEWFASSADVCRLLDSIRRQTTTDATARQILAINPGLSISPERWQFAGYKGGSEPGVLNMSYLLQSEIGNWYAFSVGWKNKDRALDEKQFFALVQRILNLIE